VQRHHLIKPNTRRLPPPPPSRAIKKNINKYDTMRSRSTDPSARALARLGFGCHLRLCA
jgi:hypothetical protein